MSNVVLNILTDFKGKKAFKEADTAIGRLEKGAKKLGTVLGVSLGTAAVVAFGKAAAKAFIEDQKQASRLASVVKNLGLELSNPAIDSYIEKLTLASGVTDDQLRPAFQSLITTTGSLTKSQDLLGQAIDISAGSGVDLVTVAQDLSNAYIGKTKALTKYNLGLTTAELKTAKFVDIQQKLNDQYKGANEAYLQTYAGRLQAITTAAGEAQEAIGGALVDAFMTLTGSVDTADLVGKINDAANAVVNFIDRFSLGVRLIKAIAPNGLLEFAFGGPDPKKVKEDIAAAWKDFNDKKLRRSNKSVWADIKTPAQTAQEKAAEEAARKRAKQILDAQNKALALQKKQAALKKAGSVFDMQQIELVAALKNQLSDDERKRAELQLALLNENDVVASKLSKDILMAQDATGQLYQYFLKIGDTTVKNPFSFLDKWIEDFQKKLDGLKAPAITTTTTVSTNAGVTTTSVAPTSGVVENFTPYLTAPTAQPGSAGFIGPVAASSQAPVIYNYFGGSVVTDQQLLDQVMNGTQLASLSGSPSQIGRIAGMFG